MEIYGIQQARGESKDGIIQHSESRRSVNMHNELNQEKAKEKIMALTRIP